MLLVPTIGLHLVQLIQSRVAEVKLFPVVILEYLDDELAVMRQLQRVLSHIQIQQFNSLPKGGKFVSFCLEELHETFVVGIVASLFCVLLDQINDFSHHHCFHVPALLRIFLVALWVVFGQVHVHPDPHMALSVDAYLLLHHFEVAGGVVELLEAKQRTLEDVQILETRDVSDLAEANGSVLNVDECSVGG